MAPLPLIFSAPGRFEPHRVAQHVSLLDILPTLVELGTPEGQQPRFAAPVDGHSLVPLLHGKATNGQDTVVGEILCEGAIAPCFMVRRGRHKYVYSEPDPDQLYDLEADPHELENLATHPAYQALREALRDEVLARWDSPAIHQQVLASQRRRRLVARSLESGPHTSWDFQPQQDASRQYMRSYMNLDDLERRARFPTPEVPPPDLPAEQQA